MKTIGGKNELIEAIKKQEFKKKHKEGKKNKQTWVIKKEAFFALCQKKTFSKSAQQAFDEFVRLSPKQTDLYIS